MLPNFNPFTVSSDPGQDLVDEALSVLMGGHASGCGDLALVRLQPLLCMYMTYLVACPG
jgi:hypothetical protein